MNPVSVAGAGCDSRFLLSVHIGIRSPYESTWRTSHPVANCRRVVLRGNQTAGVPGSLIGDELADAEVIEQ
jgi:hypothetical protein